MTAIEPQHAIKVAERIRDARNGRKLARGLERQLWALLESTPEARRAFSQPHDRRLDEHVETLSETDFWSGYSVLVSLYQSSGR